LLTTLLELAGLALIVAGLWQVATPIGLMAAGVACLVIGVSEAKQ
jgi:hypothetical protein